MEELLREFLNSPVRNQWLEFGPVSVYVRKSTRKGMKCLDLANITVDPDHRRKGHFKATLELFQKLSHVVFIEQVLNPRLQGYLNNLCTNSPQWQVIITAEFPSYLWVEYNDTIWETV